MPADERDISYLWDMLDAACAVREFIAGRTIEDYRGNRMLRAAVERQIEIIGEAARQVSQEFRASHAEIPWKGIIAQRHVLAHGYGEIEDDLIWKVASAHVPVLIAALEPLVPKPRSDSTE